MSDGWIEHPLCFDTIDDYRAWVVFAKRAKENVSPCDDCTHAYREAMRRDGRCDPQATRERFKVGG